jgi:two-component system, OmpR family, phosphate regulon sensor histidine kinase PhoR
MWFLAGFLALCAIGAIHVYWRNRHYQLRRELADERRKLAALEEHQREIYSKAEAQQEALFNSMLEGFLLLDDEGRIYSANNALTRLLGTNEDIRGKTLLEAFTLPELHDLAQRVSAAGQVRGFELELKGPVPRTIEVNAAALYPGRRRSKSMILVFHDLTRLKQLENTRKEFVANVSHELRTPLTLIKGCAETLLDGAANDPPAAQRFIEVIKRHTDRLTFLIEDLLTISRLESGQVVLTKQRNLLRPLVQNVLEDLSDKALARSVTLINSVPEDFSVVADFDRLEQVLFNLVDNSVKYGKPNGQVTVAARQLEKEAQIRVADDGPGIPPEARERIFERFYRLDRARSREQGGTGLGLAIVKHIVQSHGGEVWVESVPGQGASFFLTLPGGD